MGIGSDEHRFILEPFDADLRLRASGAGQRAGYSVIALD
jgi:hypothetical protein